MFQALKGLVLGMVAKHGAGMLHHANTNVVEGVNSMATRMTPKALCVAFGRGVSARQAATVGRWNDGLEASVTDTLARMGATPSGVARDGMQRLDARRARETIRKRLPRTKAKRKRATATRAGRTQAEDAGNGDDAYSPGMAF